MSMAGTTNDDLRTLALVKLGLIIKAFPKLKEECENFTEIHLDRVTALLSKATELGHKPESLRLICVPPISLYDFRKLVDELCRIRNDKNPWLWHCLWVDKKEDFQGFGLGDEVQFSVLLSGEDQNGLFFTRMTMEEQAVKAERFFAENVGTTWLSPAAYISMLILLANDGKKLLDDEETSTLFVQYGLIKTIYGSVVPMINTSVGDKNPLTINRHCGSASMRMGIRIVMEEEKV
jgi:hypothetical protein